MPFCAYSELKEQEKNANKLREKILDTSKSLVPKDY